MRASREAAAGRELMDGIYRYQRHIYDVTRKYFLPGRDTLIAELEPPADGTVLEIGCGTGRNLIAAARQYRSARLFGIDISPVMLATARANIERSGLAGRIRLAEGDAAGFDTADLFGEARFDRVFFSYSLSMIPPWRQALAVGAAHLAPGGRLHVVDFGDQQKLPGWFTRPLNAWLGAFHVTPRRDLATALATAADEAGARFGCIPLYRGYSVLGRIALG